MTSNQNNIPIAKPDLNADDIQAVTAVLQSGWLVQGPQVKAFEKEIATLTNTQFAVATSNCTTALHLALKAKGIGPGDHVIVPAFTWISCAHVVKHCGATPVFCDINLDSFNLCPQALQTILENDQQKKIKCVMTVDLFGKVADFENIRPLVQKHGAWILEDAACAIGSAANNKQAGSFGLAGCFSFHPRKIITTGEGGALVTNDAELAKTAQQLRDHGAARSDHDRHQDGITLLPDFEKIGFNFRMTDMQAALGLSQLTRLKDIIAKRNAIAQTYQTSLQDCPELQLPQFSQTETHTFQAYVTLVQNKNKLPKTLAELSPLESKRNQIMKTLADQGIATRQGTHAIPLTKAYPHSLEEAFAQFPNAIIAEKTSLALPVYSDMTIEQAKMIADQLQNCLSL